MLDEPVNVLDPQGIIDIRELILKLNQKHQITVIISSHILDELSKLATHYGFIDCGYMVKKMSAEELQSKAIGAVVVLLTTFIMFCAALIIGSRLEIPKYFNDKDTIKYRNRRNNTRERGKYRKSQIPEENKTQNL